ncbi:hypothetical protein [Mycobacterium sp. 3519A]|uniref:hypothetical protein n=1 Tax=Mycobacterium sp. 3519A TaxID=2057184 RepID=UPI000C7B4381|nr:hypothetical protein [Mycobacterium sp. 3519A]
MLEHNGRSVPGPKARLSGAGGSVDGVHWVKNSLLAVIAICALAGIVSTASMGQTQAALAIGIVALAFFSRAWC